MIQLSFLDICTNFKRSFKLLKPSTRSRKRTSAIRVKRELFSESKALTALWLQISNTHFPQLLHIKEYRVGWSTRRQKRTLASCCIERKMIRVARELNYPELHSWLEPLLYHEMCHAVLGHNVPTRNRKRCWHGQEFKQLERKHPRISDLDNWIKSGGWSKAVRSDRAKRAHRK